MGAFIGEMSIALMNSLNMVKFLGKVMLIGPNTSKKNISNVIPMEECIFADQGWMLDHLIEKNFSDPNLSIGKHNFQRLFKLAIDNTAPKSFEVLKKFFEEKLEKELGNEEEKNLYQEMFVKMTIRGLLMYYKSGVTRQARLLGSLLSFLSTQFPNLSPLSLEHLLMALCITKVSTPSIDAHFALFL